MLLQMFRRRRGGPRFTLIGLLACVCLIMYLKGGWTILQEKYGGHYGGLKVYDEDVARDLISDDHASSMPADIDVDDDGKPSPRSKKGKISVEKQVAMQEEELKLEKERAEKEKALNEPKKTRKAMVLAAQNSDDTAWLEKYFDDWEHFVYNVDKNEGKLTVPKNKGRESMVYLTFIIDNYDDLPDNILFIHPTRFQWHNDDPDYDGVPMLRRFQIPYLEQEGYVNLRCAWVLGCPQEIRPLAQDGKHRQQIHAGEVYKQAFLELFPGRTVPETVAASCCAQFGATKWKIRQRRREEYEEYRDWVLNTPLEDSMSGRVMEYSWHMIFGKQAVHCPREEDCYCNAFGVCDLECAGDDGKCKGMYTLPPYSQLPKGWPLKGWEGEPRTITRTDFSYEDEG